MKKKRIIVSVSNDLNTDRRVARTCQTLYDMGFDVLLVGRKMRRSMPLDHRPYKTKRMRLLFNKGPLFYAALNIRLFWLLLFSRSDVLLANDLDTLWPNRLISKWRNKKLVYDTHEVFTEMPELVSRPRVQRIWERIEKRIFPGLETVITVNDSVAKYYREKYGKDLHVVRNIGSFPDVIPSVKKSDIGIPEKKRVIILQGAGINIDRGGEEMLEAMRMIDNAVFLIIGEGTAIEGLKEMATRSDLKDRVVMLPRMDYDHLLGHTRIADLGVSLDKPTNINYRYSLPNKLFDYVHAGVPVLASNLDEVARLVQKHDLGLVIEEPNPRNIADEVNALFNHPERLEELKQNCLKAALELNWDHEKERLEEVFKPLLGAG